MDNQNLNPEKPTNLIDVDFGKKKVITLQEMQESPGRYGAMVEEYRNMSPSPIVWDENDNEMIDYLVVDKALKKVVIDKEKPRG